ncbi:MAG: DUF5666 domain-containing protein [Gammaproteobacteria bacterium]|nr:DUF5666 domain-containing protein [Gammaproteobacteria bacterium]
MRISCLRVLGGVAIGVLLAGCGGGGGGGAAPATGSDVVSRGVITGFGSVIVNGVRFDTNAAVFTVDDAPGGQDDLAVGDVVRIHGRVYADGRTGTATEVIGEDAVEGPVTAIDVQAGTLVVAGQPVITDAETSFDDNIPGGSLAGLVVGDFVEVAGFFDAVNAVRATRVERKPAGSKVEVHGPVTELDTVNQRFRINALLVDYSTAILEDFPGGQISPGDFVEVKGTMFVGGALLATKVEREVPGADDGDLDADREIEGLITRFVSPADFDVAGRAVTTTSATTYENGSAADLGVNLKVEVEGAFNSAGVLVARKVSIRRASNVRVTALVDSVDSAAGTLVVLGITVNVDAMTRLEDKSDADLHSFSLANLSVGDYVEVRGAEFPVASGRLLARRLEREDVESRSIVQGPVTAVESPALEVFGVTVQTGSSTEFEGRTDNSLSPAEFFAMVAVGDLVKARGSVIADRVIQAEEVEFESEDD